MKINRKYIYLLYITLFVLTIMCGKAEVKANSDNANQTVYISDIVYDEQSGYYVQSETTTDRYYDENAGCYVTRIQTVKNYYLYDGTSYIYVNTIRSEENIYEMPEPTGAPTGAPTLNPTKRPAPTKKPNPTIKPGETQKPTQTPAVKPTQTPVPTLKPTMTPTKAPIQKPTATPYVITPYVEFDTEPVEFKAVRSSNKKALITWDKNKKADGYYIFRSTKEKGEYKLIKTLRDASIVSYTDKNLKTKKVYYYKIQAYVYTLSGILKTEMSERNQVPTYKTQKIEYKLDELQKKFPSGKYWNHVGYKLSAGAATYNYVTSKPCKNHDSGKMTTCNSFSFKFGKNKNGGNKFITGYQCYGFASYLNYKLFGNAKINTHKSYKKAKVGDHVRKNNHSMIIIEKYDEYVIVAECNADGTCCINWGTKVRKSKLKNAVYYTRC